ncbi:MAG: hypothetical protein HZC17_03755 [Candidatus Omnitrophica bacterium]|nr:hypothetical protein [Candidatus Omnitrophota bacterium]
MNLAPNFCDLENYFVNKDIQKIREILKNKARYSTEAYQFVLLTLRFLMGQFPKPRHVSGRELLSAVKEYGFDQYGFLASKVFESWGVKETVDFGHIVFDLVEMDVLRKTEQDSIEDFRGVYQFTEAFKEDFLSSLEKF